MMLAAAVGSNSRALWYLTRGFGIVSLILLTLTTVLGLAQAVRYARPGLPRFVISAIHRNGSLLAVSAIAIHVVTAVLDSFAPIHVVDLFVPFASSYRPFWTGMGALALDLMLAVIITSLIRERIGHRAWRAVHWAAYASWPIALVHGLGTGTDSKLGWVLFLYVGCTFAVVASLWWRLSKGWTPVNSLTRGSAVVASIMVPILIAAWAASGPLKAGWARRAGTPSSLLASGATAKGTGSASSASGQLAPGSPGSGSSGSASASGPGATTPSGGGLALPLSASLVGTQSQTGPDGNGLVSVIISGTFRSLDGTSSGDLRLVLTGQPVGGGVSLTGSQVSLGPAASPAEYTGHVTQLQETTVIAALQDSQGQAVTATITLEISRESSRVRGQIQVQV